MEEQHQKKNPKKSDNPFLSSYGKITSIAFQMIVVIMVFVWGGKKLDQKFHPEGPLFIIILSIFGIFIALYTALKDFIKFKK